MKKKRKKFLTCWSGPYRITDKASSVTYQININGKKKWVHTNQLRSYFGPAPQHSSSPANTESPPMPSVPSLTTDDTETNELDEIVQNDNQGGQTVES